MTACPNCRSDGLGRFCPGCGQESPRELTVRAWLAEALDELLFVDGRLPRTLKALMSRPGLLSVEWQAGRRARYVRPLRLYLLALAAGFLYREVEYQFVPPAGDALHSDLAFQIVLIVLSVPGMAILTRLALLRSGVRGSFLPYLIFSVHTHAAALLVFMAVNAVLLPLELAIADLPWQLLYAPITLCLVVVYLIVGLRRWADLTWTGAIARGLVVVLGYFPLAKVMAQGIELIVHLTYG